MSNPVSRTVFELAIDDPPPGFEPTQLVAYGLFEGYLRSLLELAAAGEDVDRLMLSVEAASLEDEDDE